MSWGNDVLSTWTLDLQDLVFYVLLFGKFNGLWFSNVM